MKFELPNMLSYHSTWDDADYPPQLPARRRGIFTRLVEAVATRVNAARARRSAQNELLEMSDRELADLGLSRYDVTRLFDPKFADEYESRRL